MSTVPQPESMTGSVRPPPPVTYKEQKPARPLALPAQSMLAAATIEERVHALANSRDPAEYLEVYQLIEECLELERSKEIEKVEVRKVRKGGKEEFEVQTSKLSGDELEAKRKSCATMSGRTRLDRFELLKYAADHHAPGAIAPYMFQGPNGDIAALLERRDDPQVAAWRKQVTAKLQEGIDLGYPDALLHAFSGYSILGNEPTAADMYTIALASNKVIGAINHDDGLYAQKSLDGWSAALSPQQRSEAQNRAERIFLNWKQRTDR